MKIPRSAKYIGAGLISSAIAITVVHSYKDEPLSDINPALASADENFDNRVSVDEWVGLLSKYDKDENGQFSREEYDETEGLLDNTFIESYHHNIRETINNFHLARSLMVYGKDSNELKDWIDKK